MTDVKDVKAGKRTLRKHVLVRKQFWTGFWPISHGYGLKIGLRLAFGRPEPDFEVFPIKISWVRLYLCLSWHDLPVSVRHASHDLNSTIALNLNWAASRYSFHGY